MTYFKIGAVALGAFALPIAASAATIDPNAILKTVNLAVLDDMDLRNVDHVEGTTYVGGDLNTGALTGGTVAFPNVTTDTDGLPAAVIGDVTGGTVVGGIVNGNFQGGTRNGVVVGSDYTGENWGTGGLTTNVGTNVAGGVPVSDMAATFTALADSLSTLATSTGATFDTTMNSKSLTSGTGDSGLAVLNLTYAEALALFVNSENISFTIDSGVDTFLINVAGTEFATEGGWNGVSWSAGTILNAQINSNQPAVMFNFFEAEDLTMTSAWNASVLAPYALFTSPGGGINGSVVVADLILGGEIRPYYDSYLFTGTLPAPTPPVTPVPLPAGVILLGSAAAVLGALRLRRRA